MNKSTKKIIYISGLIAVVIGIIFGAEAMREAWIYNAGQDIRSDDGVIHWGYWSVVGTFWFVIISSIIFVPGLLVACIFEIWTRFKEKT